MKTKLTVEESQHLINLGVNSKYASSFSTGIIKQHTSNLCEIIENGKPIFTLIDILAIIPKEINGYMFTILWYTEIQEWEVEHLALGNAKIESELIDALYQLLIWCINNGHYNSKNERK